METPEARSIIDYFTSFPDPRILLKTDHQLIDIVVIALCAVIGGADDWVEISDLWAHQGGLVQDLSGAAQWDTAPRHIRAGVQAARSGTIRKMPGQLDPRNISKVWKRHRGHRWKTARRSHDRANGEKAIHMVNAWAVNNRLILGQVKTDDKSNEITAISEFLKPVDVKDCIVTWVEDSTAAEEWEGRPGAPSSPRP